MDKYGYALDMLCSMSVYENLKEDKIVKLFMKLFKNMQATQPDFTKICKTYSKICSVLYIADNKGSLPDYIFDKILCDENVFSKSCSEYRYHLLPSIIKKACEFDLDVLYVLAHTSSEEIKEKLRDLFSHKKDIIALLPCYSNERRKYTYKDKWSEVMEELANFHKKNGVGVFTKYCAFYFENKKIVPVEKFAKVKLDSLKKYEYQKEKIMENTSNFISRRPASNVLLYGDRGTGKSTMIKAVLSELHGQGLRMIQVAKEDARLLNNVLNVIKNMPQRFIIFIDDLTFDENDSNFNTLKAVLEGSLNSLPDNVIIYATTNRRHIIKETFSSREGNELHASDTRDENASLADRFGLTLTFTKPNLDEYFDIVFQIAQDRGLPANQELLKRGANAFAVKKASRSGRVAKQYVDYAQSRIALGLEIDKV